MTQDETVGQDEYYVDKIIGKERRPEWGGKVCYKVLWMNYGPEAATWEPVENFKDFDEAIKYEEAHKDERPQKRERAKTTPAKPVNDEVPAKRVRRTRSSVQKSKGEPVQASGGKPQVTTKSAVLTRAIPDKLRQEKTSSTPNDTGASEKTKQVRRTRSDALPRKKLSVPANVGETRVMTKPTAPTRIALDNTQQREAASIPKVSGPGQKFILSAESLYANVVFAAETEESINNADLPAEGKTYRMQEGVEVAGLYGMHCYGEGKIAVFVQYADGLFEYLPLELAEEKCPQLLLHFYRHHISSSNNEEGKRP